MTENKYKLILPTSNNGDMDILLSEGVPLFVLGANGVGKSTLMQFVYTQNKDHAKRIIAHRQMWFEKNTMNLTAADKNQVELAIKNNINSTSRWLDGYSTQRTSLSIYDLINSENIRARAITAAMDEGNIHSATELSNRQSAIQGINEILLISNIPIVLTLVGDALLASKNGCEPYSVSELSDGERNALLIGADILTAPSHTLIIIDEPERHLHRSIMSPLLTALFIKRPDCAFIISTHDIELPIEHKTSTTLLIRGCNWESKEVRDWDADLLTSVTDVPDEIKLAILGAKRKILFVEGNETTSIDKQIYQLIYPSASVVPKESCRQVESAVDGIRSTNSVHWINAYGLIDSDDRTEEQLQKLLAKGICAVPFYSAEALYYHHFILEKVSNKISVFSGEDAAILFKRAANTIVPEVSRHKERLCSRLCEKKLRNQVMSSLPKHTDIIRRAQFSLSFDLSQVLTIEETKFDSLVQSGDIFGLLARYPVRETPVLNKIVDALGVSRERYENMVRKLIIDDPEVKTFYLDILRPLTDLIG